MIGSTLAIWAQGRESPPTGICVLTYHVLFRSLGRATFLQNGFLRLRRGILRSLSSATAACVAGHYSARLGVPPFRRSRGTDGSVGSGFALDPVRPPALDGQIGPGFAADPVCYCDLEFYADFCADAVFEFERHLANDDCGAWDVDEIINPIDKLWSAT